MGESALCFSPQGDMMTTRRLFDALASGCVPVLMKSIGGPALPPPPLSPLPRAPSPSPPPPVPPPPSPPPPLPPPPTPPPPLLPLPRLVSGPSSATAYRAAAVPVPRQRAPLVAARLEPVPPLYRLEVDRPLPRPPLGQPRRARRGGRRDGQADRRQALPERVPGGGGRLA
mmetsp:Transcript_27115/g.89237  ORF Transcript_27115/g.89237 Transcript_27115/m.89237 type:complete len:171 (-) Transcript_27115:671-1183(-)